MLWVIRHIDLLMDYLLGQPKTAVVERLQLVREQLTSTNLNDQCHVAVLH